MKKKKILIAGVILLILALAVGAGCHYLGQKRAAEKEQKEKVEQEEKAQERIKTENTEKIERASGNKIPSIVLSNAQAKPGEKVNVSVSVVNNPGILGMSLTLSFDESVLKLVNAEEGTAFDGILDMNHSKTLENGCVFLWDGENLTEDQIQDGEILNLEFEVLEDAPKGKTQIVLMGDEDGTVDQNLETVNPVIENGFITVAE